MAENMVPFCGAAATSSSPQDAPTRHDLCRARGEDGRPGYQRPMAVLAPWSDHLA